MNDTTPNAVPDDVILKIQKLLALGQSKHENEAATAIRMATELLQRYNLDMAEVQGFGKPDEIGELKEHDFNFADKKYGKKATSQWNLWHPEKGPWIRAVAHAVAGANMCRALMNHSSYSGSRIWFVGPKRQLSVVTYMFYSVFNQMIELMRAAGKEYQREFKEQHGYSATHAGGSSHISVFQRSYMESLVDTICDRLQKQTEEFRLERREIKAGENRGKVVTGNELMVVNSDAVMEFLYTNYPNSYRRPLPPPPPLTPEQKAAAEAKLEQLLNGMKGQRRGRRATGYRTVREKLTNYTGVRKGKSDGNQVAFSRQGLKRGQS